MDEFAQMLLGVFGLSAIVLAWALWRGPRWLKITAGLLGCLWLFEAQWYVRAYTNIRWIDDASSMFQQDAVIAAIQAGKTRIPLVETTDFAWSAVCQVWAETPFSPAWDSETKQKVFGTDRIAYFDNGGGGDHNVLVYATGDGAYVMEPVSGRFSREFQNRFMGRYYQHRLGGKGYWIDVKTHESKDSDLGPLCFRPENIWIEISPEPAWTDNIPALVEQVREQTKSP